MSVRQAKRRRHDGDVREVWMVDVVYEHPDSRIERVQKVSPVQTRRGAEQYERTLRVAMLDPARHLRKEAPTIEAFADRWIESDAAATNAESTVREKRRDLDRHILPFFAGKRLDAVTRETIGRFCGALRQKGLGEKSVKNTLATVRRMLQCAEDWGEISRVPKLPRIKVADAPWDFFTREETDTLFAAVTDPSERALLLFAFDTGARSGEQIALQWGDLDFTNRLVVLRRASSRGKVGSTKSRRERRVPMTERLARALLAVRGLRHLAPETLVFAQADGKPLDPWRLSRALGRACARAGLRHLRRHDARHTFASQLAIAGVPLPQIQRWLGHSTIAMTMRYAHLAPGNGSELIHVLDAPLRKPDANAQGGLS